MAEVKSTCIVCGTPNASCSTTDQQITVRCRVCDLFHFSVPLLEELSADGEWSVVSSKLAIALAKRGLETNRNFDIRDDILAAIEASERTAGK